MNYNQRALTLAAVFENSHCLWRFIICNRTLSHTPFYQINANVRHCLPTPGLTRGLPIICEKILSTSEIADDEGDGHQHERLTDFELSTDVNIDATVPFRGLEGYQIIPHNTNTVLEVSRDKYSMPSSAFNQRRRHRKFELNWRKVLRLQERGQALIALCICEGGARYSITISSACQNWR